MNRFDYDTIIIGGGAAGLTAAKLAKGLNKKVAIVEKAKLGGECTWTGCVPSKALIRSAEAVHMLRICEQFGITHDALSSLNLTHIMSHVRATVQKVYATHTPDILRKEGIDILEGMPAFCDSHTIELNGKCISATSYIIATGSRAYVPCIPGLDSTGYLTNATLFDLEEIPRSMIILGGGAVGVEMACAFNRLGSTVTMLEMRERILSNDDHELTDILAQEMKKNGITMHCNVRVLQVSSSTQGSTVTYVDENGIQHECSGQKLVIATGRVANIEGLQLEKAGVRTVQRGIEVDEYLRTNAPNIYACGDVVGPYLFSHMAWQQAVVAARNACIPLFKKRMRYDHIVWVTFSTPELAAAGLTEEQARQRYGDQIRIYQASYNACDRGRIDGIEVGRGKFICDARGYLVGAHILGPRAGELIHEINLGKKYGIKFSAFNQVIHAYPTYSELIWHASKAAYIDKLLSNPLVKIVKLLTKKRLKQ